MPDLPEETPNPPINKDDPGNPNPFPKPQPQPAIEIPEQPVTDNEGPSPVSPESNEQLP